MVDAKRIFLSNSFWNFRYGLEQSYDEEDPGITQKWFESGIPSTKEKLKVFVPSSWSYFQNRKNFYYFGTGWYETTFYLPEAWGSGDGKKVTLVFNGVNYKSKIWLNGQFVGTHEGGYTKFWFEINKFVVFGSVNKLTVQVDNRYLEDRLPWFQSPDWMNYGGIFRSVYLKLTSQVCIDDYKISNEINFNKQLGEGYDRPNAKFHVRFYIKDSRPYRHNFQGSLIVTVKNQEINLSTEVPIKFEKTNEEFIDANIEVENPHLWSPEHPYLYDITFQLIDHNRRNLDREHVRWGFREFKIIGPNFYLNNRKFVLRGINRHEDHPDVGSSMSPRLIYNDLNIIKAANINCIRTSHYPPYEAVIEFADEMGLLVLEEIPLYHLEKEQYTPKFLINAQQQLWEMIHRDKNHCSVIAWIVSSECDTNCPEGREFMEDLLSLARELDPFRYYSFVSRNPLLDVALDLVDFVCTNIYLGWYDEYNIKPEEVSQLLDNIWDRIKNDESIGKEKPLVISEFGAGAIAGYKDFAQAHWSENYQNLFLKTYITTMMKKGYISGALIWHFQDFRCSPFGGFQNRPKEYNNKGIVDMHRNPKTSYFVVQDLYKKWKELLESAN